MINGFVFLLITFFIIAGSYWSIKNYKEDINYLALFLCGLVIILSFYIAFDFSTRGGAELVLEYNQYTTYVYEPVNRTIPPSINATYYDPVLNYYADKEQQLWYESTQNEIILIPSENTPHLFELLAIIYSIYGLIFAVVILGIAGNMISLGAKRP